MKNKEIEYLKLSDKVAKKSKDNSTKVGAIFFDEDNISPISFGYNGMPRGMDDNDPIKTARPEKYDWFEHAERNAIYNSAQDLMKEAIIFCSHFPNMEGARAIVSSGIKTVVVPKEVNDEVRDKRVYEMFELSQTILKEVDLLKENKTGITQKYAEYIDLANDYGLIDSHELSPNPSGVLILNKKTFSPIASGASRPPINLNIDNVEFNKENAYMWIQEPEKDAIFNAVRSKLKNCIAYVSWCPCARCGLALASVGAKAVITKEPDFTQEADLRWKDHFEQSQKLFKKLGINFTTYSKADIEVKVEQVNKNKISRK